jgi:hypothetical protein
MPGFNAKFDRDDSNCQYGHANSVVKLLRGREKTGREGMEDKRSCVHFNIFILLL